MGLVSKEQIPFTFEGETIKLDGFKITVMGKDFLRKLRKKKKYIPFGMLSMSSQNKEFNCKKRALVLKSLLSSRKSVNQVLEELREDSGFVEDMKKMNYSISTVEIK